jgi:hypothetical protein
LTFKSIDTILAELEAAGTLKRFLPVMDADQKDERELLMQPALHQWLYQSDSKKTRNYKANIRAFLGRFVLGQTVDNRDFMKSWRSNVFELRVQLQPRRETTRIFGAFARQDTFVAIHPPRLRSEFGGKDDPTWDRAIDRTLTAIGIMFPGHAPVSVRPFSGCVSRNWYDYDLNLGG